MEHELQAASLADLAESLRNAPSPVRTAEEVVAYAQQQLEADYAGITLLGRHGRVETLAPTDPVVEEVDALQYDLREGPCLDSSWEQQTLVCQDLDTETRWPRWGPKAVAHGIHGVLSVEMAGMDGRRIGAINNYWARATTFTNDDIAFAHLFARHAALALSTSMQVADLNVALDTRKRIGQAQGIVMASYDLDEDRAFEVLRRYSQDSNVKLRDVAEQVVARRTLSTSPADRSE